MVTELPRDFDYPSAQITKAMQLLEQGEYEAALQQFACSPQAAQDADNLVNQAVCLIHLSQAQAALQACDRALTLNPHHSQAWLFRGVALHRLGHYREAYACYDRAVGEHHPKHQSSLLNSGRNRFKALKSFFKHIKDTNLLRLWVH